MQVYKMYRKHRRSISYLPIFLSVRARGINSQETYILYIYIYIYVEHVLKHYNALHIIYKYNNICNKCLLHRYLQKYTVKSV